MLAKGKDAVVITIYDVLFHHSFVNNSILKCYFVDLYGTISCSQKMCYNERRLSAPIYVLCVISFMN